MVIQHVLYLLTCAAVTLTIPTRVFSHANGALLVIGAIGLWRYSWALVNFVRALVYIHIAYPNRRRSAERAYAARRPAHAFFLTTTYKIETAITLRVYKAVFTAAARAAGGATVVASVVDAADERLIRQIFAASAAGSGRVQLHIDRIAGTGKRDALARSLRTIRDLNPTREDIILLVDGDTCVPADIVERTAPFFTRGKLGALTTDEAGEVQGSTAFADWFRLRFTQRQMMMSSMALSRRVLTLTGRMSAFRADLATEPSFIGTIEQDYIDHWRLGRVSFLTGDDKSTWYWLLRNGFEMTYLPDVQSVSMETQPKPGFVDSAVTLMVRWFGNMLRTNGRALKLSPLRIGLFTWWSILDQRISIWTTLAGPTATIIAALTIDPMVIPAYLAWVMMTRYANCVLLTAFRGGWFPITYPVLLYFSQVFGAFIKSFVLFRLDRQRWTRQSTSGGQRLAMTPGGTMRGFSSIYMHALAFGWLVAGVLLITGLGAKI